MKKCLMLLFAVLCINFYAKAAPGDTTWVQANNTELTYYNNYDTTINFPALSPTTTYRKIYMIFTLGKYMCPAGSTYCGDWDYTVQNFLMTPGGDTLEIGRLITPYANAAAPRTPWSWLQPYIYDVTDYASKLHDSATMRIFFSGYSGGFTANIKFAFIEGTPERNVVAVEKLYNGSYSYGDTTHSDSNNINTKFPVTTVTAPNGTVAADLKFTVTGHGSDPNYCCEFASHNYQVNLNGSAVANTTVWRDNCGENELYPQSGTWLLERANWCPGDMVYPNFHVLPGITAGSTFSVGVTFDPYISTGAGSYTTFGTLIYYAGINKSLDASIEDIIAPTNNENYFRENPLVGQPTIHIRNSGSTVIDSVKFQYGLQDSTLQTYTWVGALSPLHDTEINLAALQNLNTIAGVAGTYNFIVEVLSVNGIADADATNDTMRSQFVSAPKWPSSFAIAIKTSNINDSIDMSIAQSNWTLYDMNGSVVMHRDSLSLATLYTDTVALPTGYYKLSVVNTPYEDGNYYGLNWWALAGAGYTPGYFKVKQLNAVGTLIDMNGYNYSGEYNNDFGQRFDQYFYVVNADNSVNPLVSSAVSINAYPNPAQEMVNVDISGIPQVNGKIQIIDELGRVVYTATCTNAHQQISTNNFTDGVYTILFLNNNSQNKLQARLIIAK